MTQSEGRLRVVGLGPGPSDWLTEEARRAIDAAGHVIGYYTYLSRVQNLGGKVVHGSDNRDELARARHGLELARSGESVVIVSGGDPGVFGMAAAVFEVLEQADEVLRAVDVEVIPGVTAMLAAASRLGAPLGNDFCAINLSDNLKPWPVIERRLTLAAQADFVIALYNPASRARSEQVHAAFATLRRHRAPSTLVAFARAIGSDEELLRVTRLDDADPAAADMRTLVIIGAEATRAIARAGSVPWLYTPRRIPG